VNPHDELAVDGLLVLGCDGFEAAMMLKQRDEREVVGEEDLQLQLQAEFGLLVQ